MFCPGASDANKLGLKAVEVGAANEDLQVGVKHKRTVKLGLQALGRGIDGLMVYQVLFLRRCIFVQVASIYREDGYKA
jgi:hypothetical protein